MAHKWIDSQAGKLKVDEAGNIVDKHPYKYYSVANKIVRVSINPDGTEGDAEFFQPRTIVSYHPETGEIMGSHTGFIEAVELEGIGSVKVKDNDGVEGLNIEITGNIPVDYTQEKIIDVLDDKGKVKEQRTVKEVTYKVVNGELVKR